MSNTKKFQNDLALGQEYEQFLAYEFLKRDYEVEHAPNVKFTDWDLKISKKGITKTIEVKYQHRTDTGNIAIEYGKVIKGKFIPSGLSTSQADILFTKINGLKGWYSLPMSQVQKIIQNKNLYRVASGGDRDSSRMILIPIKDFIKICKLHGVPQPPINKGLPL